MRRLAIGFLALVLLAAVPALAQEEPPARVGRVSFVSGQLSFHLADETQWSEAAVNYPVATGGSFWTDPKSRAEIRVGVQTINLSNNTELDVVKLNDEATQLALPQGRIGLHVRQIAQGSTVEVDLPRGVVWLLQPGIYDIDAGTADQPGRVTVFEGSARFAGGTLDLTVKVGDAAVIRGSDTLAATIERAAPDPFVEWCRSRDYQEKNLAAPKYVSPHMTGYEELDQYGSWTAAPQYGQVWYPKAVAADWAPYREGHWVSVAPWGWTWVDAQPWGFAPFHYGRWARIQGRWGWIPGRIQPRPVYAPALVAFIGGSSGGFTVAGTTGPAVGWFPLAPNEVYVPSYSRNPTYIRNVNITNVTNVTKITNITNVIVNRPAGSPPPQVARQTFANRAAATVVPVQAFTSSAKVGPAVLRVPPQTLEKAAVSERPPQVTPAAVRPAPPRPTGAPAAAVPANAPAIRPPGTGTKTEPGKTPAAQPPGGVTQTEPGKPPATQPPGAATKTEPGKPPAVQPPGAATKTEPGKPPAVQPPGAAPKTEPGKPPAVRPPGDATKTEPGKPPAVRPPGDATKTEPGKPPAVQPPGGGTKTEPGKPPATQPPGGGTKTEHGKPPATQPPGDATKTEPGKPPATQPPGAATKTEPGKPPATQPPGAATKTEPGKPPATQPPGAATKTEPGKPPAAQPPGAATKTEPGKPPAVQPRRQPMTPVQAPPPAPVHVAPPPPVQAAPPAPVRAAPPAPVQASPPAAVHAPAAAPRPADAPPERDGKPAKKEPPKEEPK